MTDTAVNPTERRPQASATLLWTTVGVWLLLLTALASFRNREGSALFEQGGLDVQVVFQIVTWFGLGALGLYLIASGRADLRLVTRGPLFWYACFVCAALLSMVFSPSPPLTAFRACQHAVALVLVISMRQQLRHVYALIIMYVAVNWLLLLIALSGFHGGVDWIHAPVEGYAYNSGDGMRRWRFWTAYGHPSWISIVSAAGAIGLSWRARRGQWAYRGPLIAWLVLTTVLTVSRTAIAGMAVGFVVVLAGRRTLLPWICLVGFFVPLVFMSTDVREPVSRYMLRGQNAAEFQSLTGRVDLYGEAMRRIGRSLPLGTGFQSGRVHPLYEDLVSMAHAHNLFVEALTGMGVLGGLVVVLITFSVINTIWQLVQPGSDPARRYVGWELCAVSVPLVAFCVMDSGFVTSVNQVVMLYLVVMARAQTVLIDGEPMPADTHDMPHHDDASST